MKYDMRERIGREKGWKDEEGRRVRGSTTTVTKGEELQPLQDDGWFLSRPEKAGFSRVLTRVSNAAPVAPTAAPVAAAAGQRMAAGGTAGDSLAQRPRGGRFAAGATRAVTNTSTTTRWRRTKGMRRGG